MMISVEVVFVFGMSRCRCSFFYYHSRVILLVYSADLFLSSVRLVSCMVKDYIVLLRRHNGDK